MLQYKIPQNVEREDQILAFLTIRQLAILAVGGGISYVFYVTLAPAFFIEVWGPLVFFPSVIAICVAFININGVSFSKYFFLFLEFIMAPKKRIWCNKQTADHELKALVTMVNKKKAPKKNKKGENSQPKKEKTLTELIDEIDVQKASYKKGSGLSLHEDGDFFDEEEEKRIYTINELSSQQREKGYFGKVVAGQKEENMRTGGVAFQVMSKPEEEKAAKEILNEMTEKVKEVRPNLGEKEKINEIMKENQKKINN